MTCCGLGPHNAALSALIPSSCPMMSENFCGRIFAVNGSLKEILRIFANFSFSLREFFATATLLPC